MELHFRQFQASDSAALSQIIRETWRYDTFCPPSTASRLAKAYLYGCLAHQTYTQVALIHDVPVGIIMVNDQRKRRSPLSFRLKQSFLILSLLCSQKGRAAFRLLWEAEKVDQELLRRCSPYDGELSFFAVSRRCRGAGIGKLLFDQAMTYMRREGFSSRRSCCCPPWCSTGQRGSAKYRLMTFFPPVPLLSSEKAVFF